MKLYRGLIKQQARGILNGNVWKMFFIYFVIYVCMTALIGVSMGGIFGSMFKTMGLPDFDNYEYYNDYDFDEDYGFYDYDYFDNFGEDFNGEFDPSDFYNFQGGGTQSQNPQNNVTQSYTFNFAYFGLFWLLYMIGFVVFTLLMPLEVSLQGQFVSLIRGKRFTFGEGLSDVFGNTFKKNYGKKLGLVLLRMIIMGLLSYLLVIPGIIYYYSTYFANQIMCDNPDISPSKALETSKKMVKGNRTELFVMNLSFIPWYLLCGITLGLGYIYVLPYIETTNALYYENFRIRAMQDGRVNEDDFLSDNQIRAKYANIYANPYGNPQGGNPYYGQPQGQPNGNPYQQNTNPQYQPYGQPNGQGYNPQPNAGCQPPQSSPVQNAAPVYQQPAQPSQSVNAPTAAAPQQEAVHNEPQTAPDEEPKSTTILNGEPLDENQM